jgi:hypothetical protein
VFLFSPSRPNSIRPMFPCSLVQFPFSFYFIFLNPTRQCTCPLRLCGPIQPANPSNPTSRTAAFIFHRHHRAMCLQLPRSSRRSDSASSLGATPSAPLPLVLFQVVRPSKSMNSKPPQAAAFSPPPSHRVATPSYIKCP